MIVLSRELASLLSDVATDEGCDHFRIITV